MTNIETAKQYERNRERLLEMAQTIERERRTRTEAEDKEYRDLVAQNQRIQMAAAASEELNASNVKYNLDQLVRDAAKIGYGDFKIRLTRSLPQTSAALANTGIIPIDQQELLKPLRPGLIYDKLGINIQSGLKGSLRWPINGTASAYWTNEGEEVDGSVISYDKLTMSGEPISAWTAVTKVQLEDSTGVVEGVIREELPAAITRAINSAMFLTSKTYKKGNETLTHKVYGPLADAETVTFKGTLPTRGELVEMKNKVLCAGLDVKTPCWVMDPATYCALEDTKVDNGSGRFLIENDNLLGYPVFVTAAITAGHIGFGDWSYLAAGFFGDAEITVDPYVLATKQSVRFILNWRFGMVALRNEAFVLGAPAEEEDEE